MKKLFASSLLLCAGLLASARGTAQTPDQLATTLRLEQAAKAYTAHNAFMGAVLVAKDDAPLLNKGYGMASLEWNIPNAPDTKFRIGSVTKQFTAALVLLLQQDGKLAIADPVSKYLPDLPASWAKITLAQLLGHTSGIPSFTDEKEFPVWSASPRTAQEEIALVKDKPLRFEPGSKFEYSNTNFEVLGTVIEKVSGRKYGDLLRERIFDPLGMKDTGLDNDELVLPKRAEGYRPGAKDLVVARSESMSVPWAAGSIYTTTGDLLKWEDGLFGGKVLSPASLKIMTTPGLGNYGAGVFIEQKDGVETVSHGGGIEGFNASLLYAPTAHLAVIVLANVNGNAPFELGKKLLDVALGMPVVLPGEHKTVPIASEELKKFLGVYDLTPNFALTIALGNDGLTVQGTGQPAIPVIYEGSKDGHPLFYSQLVDAEIEFVPDANGAIRSLILHQGGHDLPGARR